MINHCHCTGGYSHHLPIVTHTIRQEEPAGFLWKRLWPSTRCGSASKGRVHKATNSGEFPFDSNNQLLYLQDHQKLPSATPSTQARSSSAKLPTAIRCRQAGESLVAYPFPVVTGLLRTRTTTALPCQLPENAQQLLEWENS